MKEVRRRPSPASAGTDQFDDEITLPLRIVCERRPESGQSDSPEVSQPGPSGNETAAARKLGRATLPLRNRASP